VYSVGDDNTERGGVGLDERMSKCKVERCSGVFMYARCWGGGGMGHGRVEDRARGRDDVTWWMIRDAG